ncbi:hypothetical protein [Rhodoferax bucti]|uniref:hypothetical protein n=1 Tax=Rhodoferax bucti TaxID=2576305 RepID=UPI001107D0AC|nr:hypothetical protein [Rhodoferax bucti]
MDNYNCTCNGLNTNCFHCYGTGLVENATPMVGRPQRNLANAVNSSKKQNLKKRPPAPAKTREYTNCKQCGTLVRASRLQQHLQKAHPVKHAPNEENPTKQNSSRPFSDSIIPPCPICRKQKTSYAELRVHLTTEHGRNLTDPNKSKKHSTKTSSRHSQKKTQDLLIKTKTPAPNIYRKHDQRQGKDDVDALDHPSRLPGSYGSGKRR